MLRIFSILIFCLLCTSRVSSLLNPKSLPSVQHFKSKVNNENRFIIIPLETFEKSDKLSKIMTSKSGGNVLKLTGYYFLLYFFTVVYNVANKRVLNELPLPTTLATVQLFLGIPLFLPIWMYRAPKNMNQINK